MLVVILTQHVIVRLYLDLKSVMMATMSTMMVAVLLVKLKTGLLASKLL